MICKRIAISETVYNKPGQANRQRKVYREFMGYIYPAYVQPVLTNISLFLSSCLGHPTASIAKMATRLLHCAFPVAILARYGGFQGDRKREGEVAGTHRLVPNSFPLGYQTASLSAKAKILTYLQI